MSTFEAGMRLRYEIIRELAPYLGVSWVSRAGTGGRPREGGSSLVAGFRWWY